MLDILHLLIGATTTHALALMRHGGSHIANVTILVRMVTLSYLGLVVLIKLLLEGLLDELVFEDSPHLLLVAEGGRVGDRSRHTVGSDYRRLTL